jgi:GNAT superfamily N-acetyltransferase
MEIVTVSGGLELQQVRGLFEEYWNSFGFTPCFQNFGEEVASLPGVYVPPGGRLGLAYLDGEPAGCAALRQFDSSRCEAKRLYVRPKFRGLGLGRDLIHWLIAESRAAGYSEMLGDTMPVMAQALEMYRRMGFEPTGPYSSKPTEGAIYLRLKL